MDSKWKLHGVRVVHSNELDVNTAQTPGMNRAAAITHARAGAEKLWAGTVVIHPKAKTGAHHHGPVESVIYVVSGRARMRWGDKLEFVAEAGPGDFIYVPPYVPHQEINASDERAALVRAVPQRPGAGRGEPRHPGGREARGSALGGQHSPGAEGITRCSRIARFAVGAPRQPRTLAEPSAKLSIRHPAAGAGRFREPENRSEGTAGRIYSSDRLPSSAA